MDIGNEVQKFLSWTSVCGNLGLHLLWLMLHLLINFCYGVLGIARMLQNMLICNGLLKSYNVINISKVRYLAVAIESEEACQTSKVVKLVHWLSSLGIKHVCLYDREGVLKKFQEVIIKELKQSEGIAFAGYLVCQERVDLEFVSSTDSKPAMARAVTSLFVKHYGSTNLETTNFTESDVSEELQALGYDKPDPDLLLIYGPVRCHMGFPAWRLRYTEIVHMGPLKAMKYGSLIKAIHKFTKVHQNYGQ